MLTRKQHQLLLFIARRLNERGISPSFDEMREALGLKSKSGVHRLITGLEERHFIRRLPHRARALEVLRMPDSMAPADAPGAPARGFSPTVIKGDFTAAVPPAPRAVARADDGEAGSIALPLYGKIAAGTPIEALRDETETIHVPASMIGAGEYYALKIEGDSMVDAGIYDGDTAIIQRCQTADNGTIVVALVDNGEVTLKRLRRRGQSIALEPANKAYETRIFGPDQVKIQGRIVGLFRRY